MRCPGFKPYRAALGSRSSWLASGGRDDGPTLRLHGDAVIDFDVFQHVQAGGAETVDGGVGLIEAEDQRRPAKRPEGEGVHVVDVDLRILEQFQQVAETAAAV